MMSGIKNIFLTVLFLPVLLVVILFLLLRWFIKSNTQKISKRNKDVITIGFFHPYCNAGGGGERVLWTAIRAIQTMYSDVDCVIYTGDVDVSEEQIINSAKNHFGISLPRSVKFVFLTRRKWVEAYNYPYFTLLGQSLGSMYLGMEALMAFVPDIYIDTMGYSFTLPLFKYLGSCLVACYVHYPTISTDMLTKVSQRSEAHNNRRAISRSQVLTAFKVIYYYVFAALYGCSGRCANVIMTNSSWTKEHILTIWKKQSHTFLVYPPCNIKEFCKIPLQTTLEKKEHKILSIAQFRPEKDHPLQIRALYKLLKRLSIDQRKKVKLVLAGSCRNEEDMELIRILQQMCSDLNLEKNVEFRLNLSFTQLKQELEEAELGIHTMWNEHFGIGIVECMAAGVIMIAHNSGGPKMDIVVDHNGKKTGFLAENVKDYADIIEHVINLSPEEQMEIRTNARSSIARFSEEEFEKSFLNHMQPLISVVNFQKK